MIEILPYILIIVSWNPANPEPTMSIQNILQPSLEDCEHAGRTYLQGEEGTLSRNWPKGKKYFCIQTPSNAEFEAMLRKHS